MQKFVGFCVITGFTIYGVVCAFKNYRLEKKTADPKESGPAPDA